MPPTHLEHLSFRGRPPGGRVEESPEVGDKLKRQHSPIGGDPSTRFRLHFQLHSDKSLGRDDKFSERRGGNSSFLIGFSDSPR